MTTAKTWLAFAMTLILVPFVLVTVATATVRAPEDVSHLTPAQRVTAGDDNADGWIDEDESGWACHLMGNRLCGPL